MHLLFQFSGLLIFKYFRLKLTGNAPLVVDSLTDYELMIAAHLVHPQDIKISWEDIAGLESLIQELRETVILPIQRKELFADSQLTTAPKGYYFIHMDTDGSINLTIYFSS